MLWTACGFQNKRVKWWNVPNHAVAPILACEDHIIPTVATSTTFSPKRPTFLQGCHGARWPPPIGYNSFTQLTSHIKIFQHIHKKNLIKRTILCVHPDLKDTYDDPNLPNMTTVRYSFFKQVALSNTSSFPIPGFSKSCKMKRSVISVNTHEVCTLKLRSWGMNEAPTYGPYQRRKWQLQLQWPVYNFKTCRMMIRPPCKKIESNLWCHTIHE